MLGDTESNINELKAKQNQDRDDLNRLIKNYQDLKKKDFYSIFPKANILKTTGR